MLVTSQNQLVILPNRIIHENRAINYSHFEQLRADMTYNISYDDDLQLARQLLKEVAAADERVLAEPACTVAVQDIHLYQPDSENKMGNG